jgi:glyoxylase-like metal-dependent hydrolase (beta-lactamase superfamily II)
VDLRKLKSKGCNVYLLEGSLLVDTGIPRAAELIESQLSRLDGILITHAHFDHIGSAAYLQRRFGCEVFIHREDMPYLLGEKRFRYSGILGMVAVVGERLFRVERPDARYVRDVGDVGELGLRLEIFHTPGHTPGSVCVKAGDRLICGDLFRGGRKVGLSPKAFCSDYDAYLNSVKFASKLDFSIALPGHGDPIPKVEVEERLKDLERGNFKKNFNAP